MLIYTSIFIITLLYYYLAQKSGNTHNDKWLGWYMFGLASFVGLGDMIGGYDRYIYGDIFDTIADETWSTHNFASLLYLKTGMEWGYFIYQILISFITQNRYIFILITTIFAYYLYYRAFKKYIYNYPLACIIFLGFYYYFTMTYLREIIAIGIAWQSIKYILERKPIKFFAIMLLAATFHGSIIIFSIMYFIPFKKFSKRDIKRFMIFCLILGLTPLPTWLISVGGDVTGKGSTQDYSSQEQGFRIEYVLEVIFILWIIFKNYSKINTDRKTLTFLNMCYALCGILLIFMRFGQGGRFTWPFFFGLFYILPLIISQKARIKNLKAILIGICFLLFMRITISWGDLLYPYKTFLTNGIPSSYSIYSKYEYDDHYTINKLYRPAITLLR